MPVSSFPIDRGFGRATVGVPNIGSSILRSTFGSTSDALLLGLGLHALQRHTLVAMQQIRRWTFRVNKPTVGGEHNV